MSYRRLFGTCHAVGAVPDWFAIVYVATILAVSFLLFYGTILIIDRGVHWALGYALERVRIPNFSVFSKGIGAGLKLVGSLIPVWSKSISVVVWIIVVRTAQSYFVPVGARGV